MAKSQRKLYSETMRELSFLSEEELYAYQMRWGFEEVNNDIIEQTVGMDYYTKIPPATAISRNAMYQIKESFLDPVQRKEWADRIEGKAMQTNVNLTSDNVDDIKELKKYTTEALENLFKGM